MKSLCEFLKQMLGIQFIYIIAFLLAFNSIAFSMDFPENIGQIELTDEMWQILPDEVKSVFVGPDDRVWYVLDHPAKKENMSQVYKVLTDQYFADSPQLYGAHPALFETNGRVWFITHSQSVLIGYDGVNLITRYADDKQWFAGTCYNHGRTSYQFKSDNIQLGKNLFFPGNCGVHWFNGTDWNYKEFSTESSPVILRPDPDGQHLFACIYDYSNGNLLEVWYWFNGSWTKIDIPDSVKDVIPADGGAWLINNENELQFMNLNDGTVTTNQDYIFDHILLLYFDSHSGRSIFEVQNAFKNDTEMGDGILIFNSQGDPNFLPGNDLIQAWQSNYTEDSGPIFSSDGQKVWLPAGSIEMCPPFLLNLTNGEIEDVFPDENFHWFHSAKSDGMIFASTREPGQFEYALAAYQLDGNDTRNLMETMTYQLNEHCTEFCIDSNGGIWTNILDKGLARFDVNEWVVEVNIPQTESIQMLLPGERERIIIKTYKKCYYWTGETYTSYDSLKDLIVDNYLDISENFTSTPDSSRAYGDFVQGVLFDKAGYIWILESRSLSVLIDGIWYNCKSELLDAGSRNGEVDYINRCGNGMIYASDFMLLHSKGKSFYGYVENGEPVFVTAPHSSNSTETRKAVRDVNDGLWVACNIASAAGTCDFITGQFALRIMDSNQTEELENSGWAFLSDKSGNVWLGNIRGGNPGEFNIWRDGKIVDIVDVPTADSYSKDLFSDKEGSVYVRTVAGLYNLIASAESDYSDYEVEGLYNIGNLPGNILQMSYSKQGYFVIATYTSGSPQKYYINLVYEPKPEEEPSIENPVE